MKNFKFNNKKLFIILLSGFIVVNSIGCSSNKVKENNYHSNNNYTVENSYESSTSTPNITETPNITSTPNITEEPTKNPTEKPTETPVITDTPTMPPTNTPEVTINPTNTPNVEVNEDLNDIDKTVLEYFEEVKSNVKEVLNSEKVEEAKDILKGTFITIVDFIFYDGEIKGIKFDDLSEGAKQNILKDVTTIDNLIMTKFPNYKEEIGSTVSNAYNKASELIKNGAENIKEFSKEKLGEENYNAISEAKDELVYYTKQAFSVVGEIAGTLWDSGKEMIKNWYEGFKKVDCQIVCVDTNK